MPVLLPESLLGACDLMAEYGDGALPVAGGTDVLRGWLRRPDLHQRPLVDLSGLVELRPLVWDDDALVLGALVPFAETAGSATVRRELPLVAAASAAVTTLQVQVRATWGGNLVSGGGDGAVALLASGARVELISRDGQRELAVEDLLAGGRRPDELLRRIRVPLRGEGRVPLGGDRAAFATLPHPEWERRPAIAAARAGGGEGNGGWRVAFRGGGGDPGAVARRLPTVERHLDAGCRDADELAAALGEDLADVPRSRALMRRLVTELAMNGDAGGGQRIR